MILKKNQRLILRSNGRDHCPDLICIYKMEQFGKMKCGEIIKVHSREVRSVVLSAEMI